MSFILFAVTAINPEDGQTNVLAAAPDENTVRSEILPEFQNVMAASIPQAKTQEDRATLLTILQSLAIVKLEATEVPL